jgi:alpha-beta hydrolase superfamily lysophospholipase
VRPEGTQELFNDIGSPDRQIELIQDKGHLIFEEGQFDDQVIGIVDKWLASHIEKAKLTNK